MKSLLPDELRTANEPGRDALLRVQADRQTAPARFLGSLESQNQARNGTMNPRSRACESAAPFPGETVHSFTTAATKTRFLGRAALICCLGGAVAGALMLFFLDPAQTPVYPVCLFHRLTGLDCPGCGTLRALHALLHGHWVVALHDNLLMVISLPLLAWLGFRFAWNRIQGRSTRTPRPLWLWLYLVAWLVFGVLRNLPFQPFASFAP